ncbi:hypothetical protein GCM10023263_49330 [Phytohabitans rumicis]
MRTSVEVRKFKATPTSLVVVSVVLGALLVGCGQDEPATAEFQLEPVATASVSEFTPPVGTDETDVTAPRNAGGELSGGTAGLYGGTQKKESCDAEALVGYLQQHGDKAAAWAGVLGIDQADIPRYVDGLTSVVLRTDTYVTNHGYEAGQATAAPAVLQAGTAVLVDQYGTPVTKCYCGNPLTKPAGYERPTYKGDPWPDFQQTRVTVVQSTVIEINIYVLANPETGVPFDRPTGTTGNRDTPSQVQSEMLPPGVSTASPAATPSETPAPTLTETPTTPPQEATPTPGETDAETPPEVEPTDGGATPTAEGPVTDIPPPPTEPVEPAVPEPTS